MYTFLHIKTNTHCSLWSDEKTSMEECRFFTKKYYYTPPRNSIDIDLVSDTENDDDDDDDDTDNDNDTDMDTTPPPISFLKPSNPNKRRKLNNNNSLGIHSTICPWNIGTNIINNNGQTASIRDYDHESMQSHIWYLTDQEYEWINLNENGNDNWCISHSLTDTNIDRFIPDINWRAPPFDLYQLINVYCDYGPFEGDWFIGFVVGWDHISRRHCIDYGECTEWIWCNNERVRYCDKRPNKMLLNKLNGYRSGNIKYKIAPPFNAYSYGLNDEFIKRSKQIYIKNTKNTLKINQYRSDGMVNRLKTRRLMNENKIKDINGNTVYLIHDDDDDDDDIDDDDDNHNVDVQNVGFYDYTERDDDDNDSDYKYSEFEDNDDCHDNDDDDYDYDDDDDIFDFIKKQKKIKKQHKIKKPLSLIKKSGKKKINKNEDELSLEVYPYSVKETDHVKAPKNIKMLIFKLLLDWFECDNDIKLIDVAPYKSMINCLDYKLWKGMNILCNPPYSNPKYYIDENVKHVKYNKKMAVILIPYGGNKVYWEKHIFPNVSMSVTLQKFEFVGYDKQPMFPTTIIFMEPQHKTNENGFHPHGHYNVEKWLNDLNEETYDKLSKLVNNNIVRLDKYLCNNQQKIYQKLVKSAKQYIKKKKQR